MSSDRGYVRQRNEKGTSWELQWRIDGKQFSKTVKASGIREARRMLTAILAEVHSGDYINPAKMTFSVYLEYWIANYVQPNLSPKTIELYQNIISTKIIPALGNKLLASLKPIDVQEFYTTVKTKSGNLVSHSTLQRYHSVLDKALSCAVQWQLISHNPCDNVQLPSKRIILIGNKALSKEQLNDLLAAMSGSAFYLPTLVAATTGMRRGEVLAIQWDNIDLVKHQIMIQYSVEQTKEGVRLKTPKSGKTRIVPIPTRLYNELKKIPEDQHTGFLFHPPHNTNYQPDFWGKNWQRKLQDINAKRKDEDQIPISSFHDLRHTFASLALESGINIKIIQEILGHANIQTTLNLYGHVLPTLYQTTHTQLNSLFSE